MGRWGRKEEEGRWEEDTFATTLFDMLSFSLSLLAPHYLETSRVWSMPTESSRKLELYAIVLVVVQAQAQAQLCQLACSICCPLRQDPFDLL